MGNTSKDLLHLELKNSSSSSIESTLLLCKNDSISQKKNPHPDEKLTTLPVPASQVLGKLKDFFSEVNKRDQLDTKDKSSKDYNIEELTGNESQYIEMDLMMGLADLHTPEAVAAAEAAVAGYQSVLPLEDSSDDDDDDDDDSNKKMCNPVIPLR